MDTKSFDPAVLVLLREAGWYPGRDSLSSLILPSDYPLFPVAQDVIKEFGGLRIGRSGPGIERATSSIDFNPSVAEGMAEEMLQLACRPIYPLGDLDNGNVLIFIDDNEYVHMLTDELEILGTTISSALRCLLLGYVA